MDAAYGAGGDYDKPLTKWMLTGMFAAFLYPFVVRNRCAPYLWVAYKLITDLTPDQVCFIACPAYQVNPSDYAAAGRFECHAPRNDELGFIVPTAEQVASYAWFSLPETIYQRLKIQLRSDSLIWLHLIQHEDTEFTAALIAQLEIIQAQRELKAIITWCNCASLTAAAAAVHLPLIHCELGPLRDPWYQPLGYFDFNGVNGHTEAAARYQRFLLAAERPSPLTRTQLLALLRGPAYNDQVSDAGAWAMGVALQVEDDSNLLAYHRGLTPALVLEYVNEFIPAADLLIRSHPAGYFGAPRRGTIDDSPTSMAFVRRCQALVTLNSSVAVEALLAGIPTAILGEAPAVIAACDRLPAMQDANTTALDFLLLGYCVPYRQLFTIDYLCWRLTNPSEVDIRAHHLQILQQMTDDLI
ncbi:GT99 family glycosyltransferase N-terminal domain-containing protein [Thiospirillum jenense]|uniref:Glycosyltransferase 99 N-terminal domain-containing protein n=1 Tax=Thiospirillum jenense TaxID=1653858 RepID=A0A839HMC2_9GAMM|nr:hypothetical protein [Thiospirillum jenense]MBB1126702.1 hypothetical protein [Thiospirillum jenense]